MSERFNKRKNLDRQLLLFIKVLNLPNIIYHKMNRQFYSVNFTNNIITAIKKIMITENKGTPKQMIR